MSDILAKLKSVHDAQNSALKAVRVPEYDDTWYFRPLTLADQERCRHGVNLKSASADQDIMVNVLIELARDQKGNRIFDVPINEKAELRAELRRMSPKVLMRITMQSQGNLSGSAVAELSALEEAGTKAALAKALGDMAPDLVAGLEHVDFEVIRAALADIAEAAQAATPLKNG